ncbi:MULTISPECIES: 2-keto-4-pentenoate hydratase [Enterobacteriaceae]|uniref:2-keto-4-pentenoate hydratase n=1 Tax=Escherichia coli TaxID=562 RepID=A0A2P9E613_ECOLX|nr:MULTISPECIES: fumarylacetoacetate hydrolase family protein [Enterobacteriaceae]HCU0658120.1 fumarylacetoacetate hydrolase family protein [Klebsiella quasipneumoniae]EKZ5605730.1 fumarylacetoacetate hydrolase family protein [Klebsiella pneumoniae]EKZ5764666.1 fumarylacetoacetate hydrolase family protein [Klebsiella pneumoniae]ELA0504817.1 fumarylacetoacetate hydrolase family protein [Klebsiella pneumoniae]MBZ1893269.1 fumarylacetoacetate hydrolase family protein [Klebsiella pneumoniae]
MTPDEIYAAAGALYDAAERGTAIAPLRERWPTMSLDQAYAIQRVNTERRIAAGARRVGCKIGLTSPVVQQQLGVDQPDFGVLLNTMEYGDSEPIPAKILAQPKVEAEIAFVLKQDLAMAQPGLLDVMQAIDYALPAIEIVGSRIAQWNIRLTDTVADNASSSAYVLGTTPKRLAEFDLRLCGMVMTRRGEPVSTGAGAACLGNPLNAVVWLARTMAHFGTPLRAGDVVLSGALGPMVSVSPGDIIETRIHGLGKVRVVFAPEGEKEERT